MMPGILISLSLHYLFAVSLVHFHFTFTFSVSCLLLYSPILDSMVISLEKNPG